MSWLYDMIGEEPYTAPSSSAAAPEAQSHPELLLNPPPPVAVVSTMPTFVPLDAGSDRKALLSSLLTGLFMYHLRRLGPSDLVEFISTKTGTLGIGALSTKLETGIPQGADGFTTDDEAFSMLQQMLIRIVDRNSDLSTIGIEQVRGVAVEVVAEDTVEMFKRFNDAVDASYEHYCKLSGTRNVDRRLLAEQVRLETMSREISINKYRRLKEELAICGKLVNMKVTQRLLLNWYNPLVHAICEEQGAIERNDSSLVDRRGYEGEIGILDPELLAVITLHETLKQTMTSEVAVVRLALCIGKAVADEVRLQQRLLNSVRRKPKTARLAIYQNEAIRKDTWSKTTCLKLGSRLVQLLCETAMVPTDEDADAKDEPAFIHRMIITEVNKRRGVVNLHPRCMELINVGHIRRESIGTDFMPMVVPPIPWTMPEYGGYVSSRSNVMKMRGSRAQEEALELADLTTIYKALDVLGAVPWRINARVLDVVEELWRQGGGVASLPSRTDAIIPPRTVEKGEKEPYEIWKDRMDKVKLNRETHSLRCDLELKLNIARTFNGFDFYFPHNIDFRGRAYTIAPHLQHMGSDVSRGLLLFARPKPLGDDGLFWLKVQLANLFGMDKLSLDSRADWADSVLSNIKSVARDPLGEMRDWWLSADDPFQALACCYEITDALAHPLGPALYESSLPVHMDGSCNGLQHYAALGLDEVGGRAVNLVASDVPQDVYSGVCDLVNEKVAKDAAEGNEIAQSLLGHVTRKVVKQTVMTSVYGVTFVGARKQIERRLIEAGVVPNADAAFKPSYYLSRATLDSLGSMFSNAKKLMEWMTDAATLISRTTSQAVSWITPLGLPVIQPYCQEHAFAVKTSMQVITLVDAQDVLPVSSQRQRSAFPPNYVHSLDATHMMMTALRCHDAGVAFAAVHDSYWTHAATVARMNKELRDQFVALHNQPLLENLAADFAMRYPMCEFKALPKRGTLDLNDVLNSQYFFD
ncbi:DNA-directed RNA polymerase [Plasmodiophora brassicae]